MFHRTPVLLLFLMLFVSALHVEVNGAKKGNKKHRDPRVYDTPPSDAEHDDDDDNDDDHKDDHDDDKDHDDHDDDDHKYDHDAFLGKEDAKKFDDMNPEEAKEKLAEMIVKIDTNNDTKISPVELQAWLAKVGKLERARAAESRFHNIKATVDSKELDAPLSWDDYKKALHQEMVGDDPSDKVAIQSYNSNMVRDEKRWTLADADGDKLLNKMEFADFLHPEEAPRMKNVVITEAMLTSDKNKDGKIDLTEYMQDLYPEYDQDIKNKKALPDWVQTEEKEFKEKLDKNKDGVLDVNEVYNWIVPEDFDHSQRETKHLFKQIDANKDNFLSKDEVQNKWEVLVGHQATDFGSFKHDEL